MQTINLKVEIEDTLYEDIKNRGIDLEARFQEFLADLIDDGYPAIGTKEAKSRVKKAVTDYRKNGMKNCEILDENFWNDRENRLIERKEKVS
jgi:hypothetical protein